VRKPGRTLVVALAFLVVAPVSLSAQAETTPGATTGEAPITLSLSDGIGLVVRTPRLLLDPSKIEVVVASHDELLRVSVSDLSLDVEPPPLAPVHPAANPPKTISPPPRVVKPQAPAEPDLEASRRTFGNDVVFPTVLEPFDAPAPRDTQNTHRTMPIAYAAMLLAAMLAAFALWSVTGNAGGPRIAVRG
jgi:hypothetical protein